MIPSCITLSNSHSCSAHVARAPADNVNSLLSGFHFSLESLNAMDQQLMSTGVPLLILGLGWTGTFLNELLSQLHITYVATTRHQTTDTVQWELPQDDSCTHVDVSALPQAKTVLVTFPVRSSACMSSLMDAYESKHGQTQWILLSSTRPFSGNPSDRHGPIDPSKDTSGRMEGEAVILERGGTVLHLAGLWGAQRQPRNWVPRFATQQAIRGKLLARQLHLIHGNDVARAIVAAHKHFQKGQRWIVTDGGCYDWIQLFLAWGSEEQIEMARDLAKNDDACRQALGSGSLEEIVARGGVRPRLDSRDFWNTFQLEPTEFLHICKS
ncbi:hypothetical protein BDB00DRAFT_295560 [Zychaea mexicana]|uniref:uncharacterized protein n=1 Tax=Zychaea mexicana TaxID=64656 RepID=UPI0022FEE3C5|nr:uncharacterized protein BDB00DRAFT_295560 [Zychaea mexicana]KAI9494589.1 hypothetical protein BDB00DRAFT_295560 [Zychaea mexicana]